MDSIEEIKNIDIDIESVEGSDIELLVKSAIFLDNLCNELNIELPDHLKTLKIYKEIENFKDTEYIYCIAYEMLIRTDEYNELLKEYDTFIKESSDKLIGDEFIKLNELTERMNDLGLKKTSFLGFDNDDDRDNVFKMIKTYQEIVNSPWSVRKLFKFELDPALGYETIFHILIDFYNNKKELYMIEDGEYKNISFKSRDIKKVPLHELVESLEHTYIPCIVNGVREYKNLTNIYLKELDEEFLSIIKEKEKKDTLLQTSSSHVIDNIEYWYKYYVNDIKDGLNRLIEFNISHNQIFTKDAIQVDVSNPVLCKQIKENPSSFYIQCVNCLYTDEIEFVSECEKDGLNVIPIRVNVPWNTAYNFYLININKYMPLAIQDIRFLNTIKYEDLKNIYKETEPKFSRPRLMFDEARLINLPVNLNLSKEELLLYMSQVKDEYDRDKNLVKDEIEYIFDLTLESDLAKMPTNIKNINEEKSTKRLLPSERKNFKESLATAFYIYDLYKFFLPLFESKVKLIDTDLKKEIEKQKAHYKAEANDIDFDIIKELKALANVNKKTYSKDNLITYLSYLTEDLSKEQVKYYLAVMKEFIHGVNEKGEKDNFKKRYSRDCKQFNPKYKNLIIGDSYIIKSNIEDLINSLGVQ
jgi:hypothetical protein